MGDGIDATVVLGLASKAVSVFSEPGTYLSFPITPRGITSARLKALAEAPLSPEGEHAHSEFARLVNEIPSGPLWQEDGDRLWDVYGDVLDGVELADTPPRTPEEEAAYQAAFGLLYQTAADGAVTESAVTVAYEQCYDAYRAAVQELNNRAGRAAASADPAVKEQFAADEPALRAAVDDALADWVAIGRRQEVEEAHAVLRDLTSRAPLVAWNDYRKLYDPRAPEVFFRTSSDGSTYLPTSYLPSNVVDLPWATMTVGKGELAALAESAPAELRSRLGGSSGSPVESVTFEYTAVTVSRPWFAPEVFASRAWRFRDPARVLSDGGDPPTGSCTAYVSSLVLARNITVTRRAEQAEQEQPRALAFLPTAVNEALVLGARAHPASLMTARLAAREAAGGLVVAVPEPAEVAGPGGVTDAPLLGGGALAAMRAARVAPPVRASGAIESTVVRDHRRRDRAVRVVRAPVGRPARSDVLRALRIEAVLGRRRKPIVPPPRTKPVETPTTTTSSSGPDAVFVLAFVCRRLPKAPDPDPALTWS